MSGKGKRKEDEAHSSDGEPPSKKTSRKDSDDAGDEDILVCEISKNRRVAVRSWNGRIMVDIRDFYVKDGKQMPGKKGISLSMDQWDVLRDNIEEIDNAVAEESS
ncbi:hypothetical protein Dimus_011999 [Dionaea muscipula]